MHETTYPEPGFYMVSDIMNYKTRGEAALKESVDGTILRSKNWIDQNWQV